MLAAHVIQVFDPEHAEDWGTWVFSSRGHEISVSLMHIQLISHRFILRIMYTAVTIGSPNISSFSQWWKAELDIHSMVIGICTILRHKDVGKRCCSCSAIIQVRLLTIKDNLVYGGRAKNIMEIIANSGCVEGWQSNLKLEASRRLAD